MVVWCSPGNSARGERICAQRAAAEDRDLFAPEGIRVTLIEPGAIGTAMQPCSPEEREREIARYRMLPPGEVADAILFAATRGPGVDVVTLRIEPLVQKIY